jgi:hypothetical protein
LHSAFVAHCGCRRHKPVAGMAFGKMRRPRTLVGRGSRTTLQLDRRTRWLLQNGVDMSKDAPSRDQALNHGSACFPAYQQRSEQDRQPLRFNHRAVQEPRPTMVPGRRVSQHDVPENSFRASTAVLAAKAECNAPPICYMRHFLTFRCLSNLRNLWILNLDLGLILGSLE